MRVSSIVSRARTRPLIGLLFALSVSLVPVSAGMAVGVNLSFTTSPPNPATAGVGFPVTVHVQDNAAIALPGVLVALDIPPGNNPSGGTLTCTGGLTKVSNATGDAQFTGCKIDKAGAGYAIRASATGATPVTTGAFTVQAGPATALVFSTYPANPTGVNMTPQPTVSVVDAGGNVVTTDSRTITLTINKNAGTFSCTGGTSKAAVNGVAAFTGCLETVPANNYRLTADDGAGGLAAVQGPNFRVNATSIASKLEFCWGTANACRTAPPTDIVAGLPFSLQPSIRVTDAAGNTITSDSTTTVNLAILAGTPTTGGPGTLTCTGGLAKVVVNGVANFTGCTINTAGNGYRLNATSSPVLTPATSQAFNVLSTSAATKLAFLTEPPATVVVGQPFGTIQVAIESANNTIVTTGITANVRLTLGSGPGGANLNCTGGETATTVNGVATFTGCSVNRVGNGYTLVATATSTTPTTQLTPATSRTFNAVAVAAVLSLTTTPSNGVIRWGQTVILNVHFTANGGGRPVQLQVSRTQVGPWFTVGTVTTSAGGDASFAYRPSDNRYYRAVFAGAADLPAGTSNIARVVVRQLNLLRPTNLGAVRDVRVGTGVTFTSTVRPNRPELPQAHVNFRVYKLISGQWTQVLSQTLGVDSLGRASLRVTFTTRGKFYVRSQAVPTALNANSGWSPAERYDVI